MREIGLGTTIGTTTRFFLRSLEQGAPLGDIESYQMDRNWFLFYTLLASKKCYRKPVYTVLGNHDWRIHPYGPISPAYSIAGNLQLTPAEVGQAHGPGADALWYPSSTDTAISERLAELIALTTHLDSVKWYLLLINPFLDYVAQHPGGYSMLMLDWAESEENFFADFRFTPVDATKLWRKEWAEFLKDLIYKVPLSVAKNSLTDEQRHLAEWFLSQKGRTKIIGLHAGVVSPMPFWGDDVLDKGILNPCPLCKGWGKRQSLGPQWDGLAQGEIECDCTRLMGQTVGEPTCRPIMATNRQPHTDTLVLDYTRPVYATIGRHRDWFVDALRKGDAALVLTGHTHRNCVLGVCRAEESPILPDGTFGRSIPEGMVRRVDPEQSDIVSKSRVHRPLFVSTASAGPIGTRKPVSKRGSKDVEPCWAKVVVSSNGLVRSIEHHYSALKLRPKGKDGKYK